MTVRYADSSKEISIDPIALWKRGDIAAPVMSNSSGPKDYVKNQIFALFEEIPEAVAVVMVRGRGVPFCLIQTKDGAWRDITARQVVLKS